MTFRPVRTLAAAGAAFAALTTAGVASAQYYYAAPPPPAYMMYDGPRFRGGINLGGGAIIVPGVLNVYNVGLEGQLGVQINNMWAIYAAPTFDVIAGQVGGVAIGGSILAEITFPGTPISVGVGPAFGELAAIGGVCTANSTGTCGNGSVTGVGGAYYGGKVRFEWHPVIVRTGYRRRALTLGLDVNILTGAFGSSTDNANTGTASASVNDFGISPRLWIGYTAF
jgi:hypothetical protein